MSSFSAKSLERLDGVHPVLQDLCFRIVTSHHDCTVIYGTRTITEQQKLVQAGLSKTMNSKHLIQPDGFSHAVDLAPYPVDWDNEKRFYWFAGMMRAVSRETFPKGWRLRWGGNWDSDEDLDDQKFMDLVHFELIAT